ncbi:hypothetical protein B0J18DRAFT_296168 [Chaetomium sp. MPI-SDFR-AT-0129]|nr:hypothetical protein B0J18DRAFT_296168 [Chaetomium sp. MPI-SDFR-AT-0129]
MISPLIFITGATGQVGSATLFQLLSQGYRVRAAVRSESKKDLLLGNNICRAKHQSGRLQFVVVPDITAEGAYDEAMIGARAVIHCASPQAYGKNVVAKGELEEYYVSPAVRGTLNILKGAANAGSVRRVVMTSSLAAIVPQLRLSGRVRPTNRVYEAHDRVLANPGPYADDIEAYVASKISALRASETWMEENRPAFDAVYLHPGFVLGRNNVPGVNASRAMKGSNSLIVHLLSGTILGPHAGTTVLVDDVARVHVEALGIDYYGAPSKFVPAGSYILSQPAVWSDAVYMANRIFPGAFSVTDPQEGDATMPTVEVRLDTGKTTRVFGDKFGTFVYQAMVVAAQYLELARSKEWERLRETGRARVRERLAEQKRQEEGILEDPLTMPEDSTQTEY